MRTGLPAAATPLVSSATTTGEAGLVDIQTLVPGIALEIRYAGSDNFVGAPVEGYLAPKCYLLRPAAEALARVERTLRTQQLRLKVFDCYRPVRAVQHFVRWAGDLSDQRMKPRFYPDLDKRELLGDYIAPVSGHSRGATVDLTVLQCAADGRDCQPLDMGTGFDYFGPRAHTDSLEVDAQQHANRERLRAALSAQGFRNYPLEWWHYTLTPEPTPHTSYDIPIH